MLSLALLLGGCATAKFTFEQPVVLLGEVHDNAAGHALRLAAFDAMLARGRRPALVMEQFDRDRQPALDAARADAADAGAADADTAAAAAAVIAAAGGPGWQWDFYRPFVRRALRHGLPIVAANVSRSEARAVMRDGLAAHGFEAEVPEDVLAGTAASIEASHCGQVDAGLARRMALAQIARDQAMARAIEAHAGRGVLLLAGNGHVRTDLGVPRWLSMRTRAVSEAIGVLERGGPDAAFDRRVYVAPQPRADPCAGFAIRPR